MGCLAGPFRARASPIYECQVYHFSRVLRKSAKCAEGGVSSRSLMLMDVLGHTRATLGQQTSLGAPVVGLSGP